MGYAAESQFAPDAPLERDGFEPSVPHRSAPVFGPGSGAGGDALGGDDGLGRGIEQARGYDAGAEMGNDTGGMKAGVVEAAFGRCAETDRGFHPRGVGHQ